MKHGVISADCHLDPEFLHPNNFLWGSDYPHGDGIWPDSREIIQKTMGNLEDGLRKRIIRDNAVAFYGMET